jgi:hypothetical protein
MAEAGVVQGEAKTPSDFLKSIRGKPVVVKLNSGVDYRGKLQQAAAVTCAAAALDVPAVLMCMLRAAGLDCSMQGWCRLVSCGKCCTCRKVT